MPTYALSEDSDGLTFRSLTSIEIDGKVYPSDDLLNTGDLAGLIDAYRRRYKVYVDDTHTDYDWGYELIIGNLTTQAKRVKLIAASDNPEVPNFTGGDTVTAFCLAPANRMSHAFTAQEINELKAVNNTINFTASQDRDVDINFISPLFYVSANDQTVLLNESYGWGNTSNEQRHIYAYFDDHKPVGNTSNEQLHIVSNDGSIQFTNMTNQELIVKICSKIAIPKSISPIYQADTTILTYRDESGFETCLFKLLPAS